MLCFFRIAPRTRKTIMMKQETCGSWFWTTVLDPPWHAKLRETHPECTSKKQLKHQSTHCEREKEETNNSVPSSTFHPIDWKSVAPFMIPGTIIFQIPRLSPSKASQAASFLPPKASQAALK